MQTRSFDVLYEGDLPLTAEFIEENIDKRIGVIYRMSLTDLIEINGIDEMNDYLDAVVGAILLDIEYSFWTSGGLGPASAPPGPAQDVLILATGDLDAEDRT
jgi:hypothetical protein